jgi:alkylhydroperoxidase family enzyme
MLAHGRILANRFMDAEALRTIVSGGESDALDPVDVAVMDVADKVAADATSVTRADIDRLRGLGLSDADILDVVAAAAARCFFSTVLDALGVEPDAAFNALEPGLRDALTVGRPIAPA